MVLFTHNVKKIEGNIDVYNRVFHKGRRTFIEFSDISEFSEFQ